MLESKLHNLEKGISVLEERYKKFTVRGIVRILESYICLEAVGGSKIRYRQGNHNFDVISKTADPIITAELSRVLSARGLSKDHVIVMDYLKDCGEIYSYRSIPLMTKKEWIVTLTADDIDEVAEADDRKDEEEKQLALKSVKIKTDLLNALEAYIPCPATGFWNIQYPV